MTESEFLLLISNKINNYKLKNPLEYLNIIKEFRFYKLNRFHHIALIFRDFSINNINSNFSIYYGNTNNHIINISINFPSYSLFYIGTINISSNNNNNQLYRIISTDTQNNLIINKDIYDLYKNENTNTKDIKFRKIIDILTSIDIMYIDHNNKSVYIKG